MNIFGYIEKNIKFVKGILWVLLFIPIVFQLVLSSLPLYQRLVFILYSILFLLLGFGGVYLVLGFQVILKMPKKMLKIACNFFIIFGVIFLLLQYPTTLITTKFINTGDEALTVAFIYTLFGPIIGSYRIKYKYTIE
jgi:hypothetical protein